MTDLEVTDTSNPDLNYGLVVDCGSSGSRVFVYCWPRHNGNPHDLLDIRQMRDQHRKPVVMKIKPGGLLACSLHLCPSFVNIWMYAAVHHHCWILTCIFLKKELDVSLTVLNMCGNCFLLPAVVCCCNPLVFVDWQVSQSLLPHQKRPATTSTRC